MPNRATRRTEDPLIDLKGRLATPGLNDSHLHLISLGLTMDWVDAKPAAAPTLATLLAEDRRARQGLEARPSGSSRAATTRPSSMCAAIPYREELDQAAPDNPVMLVRACGHISICNSQALKLAGITETTPTPPGGLIEKQNGRLTGLLAENARAPVDARRSPLRRKRN